MANHKPLRGGSWFSNPRFCRSAYRSRLRPVNAYLNVGFRVVCKLPKTSQMIDCKRLRGGSWYHYPRGCRSAFRVHDRPDYASSFVGFRVVCKLPLNIEND